jgi:predicted MFS family arabinose efflux permease
MLLLETTPDSSGYMIAGYAVAIVVMALYIASLYLRWRNLQQDEMVLNEIEK